MARYEHLSISLPLAIFLPLSLSLSLKMSVLMYCILVPKEQQLQQTKL